jgi:hypothetical protein
MNQNVLTPVAIHRVPRSGTTWLGEIFNSSPNTIYKFQPLFSYALKDFLTSASSLQDINEFFQQLKEINDDFIDQIKKRNQDLLPVFKKEQSTHLVYKEVRYHNILNNLMRKKHNLYLV